MRAPERRGSKSTAAVVMSEMRPRRCSRKEGRRRPVRQLYCVTRPDARGETAVFPGDSRTSRLKGGRPAIRNFQAKPAVRTDGAIALARAAACHEANHAKYARSCVGRGWGGAHMRAGRTWWWSAAMNGQMTMDSYAAVMAGVRSCTERALRTYARSGVAGIATVHGGMTLVTGSRDHVLA